MTAQPLATRPDRMMTPHVALGARVEEITAPDGLCVVLTAEGLGK
jgi:hypothetical protein